MRLDDPVRLEDGRITTPNDELKAGRASVKEIPNWQGARGTIRTAWFVDFDEGTSVEIGKMAYDSVRNRETHDYCESCSAIAEVTLADGSTWCLACHEVAEANGY